MKNGLSFEEPKKPVLKQEWAKEAIRALEAAWRVKKYCAGRICPDCKFCETVKDKGRYSNQCGLARPPEGWRLNIEIAQKEQA